MQNYLNGIKQNRRIRPDPRNPDNALVATDFPENLSARLGALIPDIDQVYDNPDEMARQMLVTQSLMKSIRGHAGFAVATSRPSDRGAAAAPAATPAPVAWTYSGNAHAEVSTRSRDEDDIEAESGAARREQPKPGTI